MENVHVYSADSGDVGVEVGGCFCSLCVLTAVVAYTLFMLSL
jgi:hypothetical protein